MFRLIALLCVVVALVLATVDGVELEPNGAYRAEVLGASYSGRLDLSPLVLTTASTAADRLGEIELGATERRFLIVALLLTGVGLWRAAVRGARHRRLVRQELADRPGRLTDAGGGAIMYGLVAAWFFFGGLALWTTLAPVRSAAIAVGVVRVDINNQAIDHPYGGVISELLVAEGDVVRAGQPLILLDRTELEAELETLARRRDELRLRQAGLDAARTGADAVLVPDDLLQRAADDSRLSEQIERQRALFAATSAAEAAEVDVRRERARGLEARVAGLERQQSALASQIALLDEEIAGLQELFDQGLTTQGRLLDLQRRASELGGELGAAEASAAEAEIQIAEVALEIAQLERQRIAESSEQLRATSAELLELLPRIAALEARLARSTLVAPTDGEVIGLTEFTIGGVIAPGELVLSIVPADAELVVEVRIDPRDRDIVAAGMEAELRLTAFNARTVAPISGALLTVSADVQAAPERGEAPHYLGVVDVSDADLARQGLALVPGMPVEVVFPVEARTPLEYLIEPLAAGWAAALTEE